MALDFMAFNLMDQIHWKQNPIKLGVLDID